MTKPCKLRLEELVVGVDWNRADGGVAGAAAGAVGAGIGGIVGGAPGVIGGATCGAIAGAVGTQSRRLVLLLAAYPAVWREP